MECSTCVSGWPPSYVRTLHSCIVPRRRICEPSNVSNILPVPSVPALSTLFRQTLGRQHWGFEHERKLRMSGRWLFIESHTTRRAQNCKARRGHCSGQKWPVQQPKCSFTPDRNCVLFESYELRIASLHSVKWNMQRLQFRRDLKTYLFARH